MIGIKNFAIFIKENWTFIVIGMLLTQVIIDRQEQAHIPASKMPSHGSKYEQEYKHDMYGEPMPNFEKKDIWDYSYDL